VFEESPIYLKTLVDSIDSPNFKVCFDVVHWYVFSKQPIEEWFKVIGEHVVELHLHDNTGEGDDHMAIGDGKIDFPLLFNIIDRYKRNLVYTIEAHSEDVLWKSLKKLDTYVK